MGEEKRSSSLGKLIVGAVLLVLISLATLALIPFQTCPTCSGAGRVEIVKSLPQTCPLCDGKGKTNLLKDLMKARP